MVSMSCISQQAYSCKYKYLIDDHVAAPPCAKDIKKHIKDIQYQRNAV
jgi:hypothetical protein